MWQSPEVVLHRQRCLPQSSNIHYIDTLCISSYTLKEQSEAKIIKTAMTEEADETWLILDDLVDTGKTAKIVREMFPSSHFATLYAKPLGLQYADTYLTCLSQDTWVCFPWDTTSSPRFEPLIYQKCKIFKERKLCIKLY